MARFSDRINLSDALKNTAIPDILALATTLLKSRGYSQSTMSHYTERFNDLQKHFASYGAERLSEEFITRYIEEGMQRNPRHTRSSVQRKSLLNLLAAAVSAPPVFSNDKEADSIRDESLRLMLDRYRQHLKDQSKRKETIVSYIQTATKLTLYLDKSGICDYSEVTATSIRDFVSELCVIWSPRSMRVVPSHLKRFLEFAGAADEAVLFASYRAPRKSKPVQAMSTENVEALWKFVEGEDGDLRDKAMVAMLLATGTRPVDITGLQSDDINWGNDTMGFVQSKTGVYMNVKLFPAIGSAIARYIAERRPKGTGQKFVFLTKRAPYRRLSSSACNRILKTAFSKVGVAFVADGLHCPRAARRSLVTKMIAEGVPMQKAAAAIGHVGEGTVDLYTELDVEKMRAICLPIPAPMKGWLMHNG